jgi:hypothetical protein
MKRFTQIMGKLLPVFIFGLASVLLLGRLGASAEGTDGWSKITIDPAEMRIDLNPDTVATSDASGPFVVKVTNGSGDTQTIAVDVLPWSDGENSEGSVPEEFAELANWTRIEQSEYGFAAGETREILFTVAVPEDAPSGGQYAFIRAYRAESSAGEENVAGFMMPLIARVSGEIRQEAKVESIGVAGFQSTGNIISVTSVQNTGNIDLEVMTGMVVRNAFTGREVGSITEQANGVLPQTKRDIETELSDGPHFGVYKVEATVKILDKEYSATRVVLVAKPKLLIEIGIGIALMVVLLVLLLKFGRRKSSRPKLGKSGVSASVKSPKVEKTPQPAATPKPRTAPVARTATTVKTAPAVRTAPTAAPKTKKAPPRRVV